jgi:DNA-binding IclR family transcriptional regulator
MVQVVEQGFAVAEGEEFLQVCGIAAPVFNFQGDIAGSVCIWSQTDKANLESLQGHVSELIITCAKISGRLGFNP